jgi:hypothetical protein
MPEARAQPKTIPIANSKNIETIEQAVQEIQSAVEIDNIVLQHKKLSINFVEEQTPL